LLIGFCLVSLKKYAISSKLYFYDCVQFVYFTTNILFCPKKNLLTLKNAGEFAIITSNVSLPFCPKSREMRDFAIPTHYFDYVHMISQFRPKALLSLRKTRLKRLPVISREYFHKFVYFCLLLFTFVYFCLLLFTFVYFCLLLFTFVYFCLLLFTLVNRCKQHTISK
jgi:hypothetical protein